MKLMDVVWLAVGAIIVAAVFGVVLAFPSMWCWNYAIAGLIGAPRINRGQAWCLWFLVTLCKPTLNCKH